MRHSDIPNYRSDIAHRIPDSAYTRRQFHRLKALCIIHFYGYRQPVQSYRDRPCPIEKYCLLTFPELPLHTSCKSRLIRLVRPF